MPNHHRFNTNSNQQIVINSNIKERAITPTAHHHCHCHRPQPTTHHHHQINPNCSEKKKTHSQREVEWLSVRSTTASRWDRRDQAWLSMGEIEWLEWDWVAEVRLSVAERAVVVGATPSSSELCRRHWGWTSRTGRRGRELIQGEERGNWRVREKRKEKMKREEREIGI